LITCFYARKTKKISKKFFSSVRRACVRCKGCKTLVGLTWREPLAEARVSIARWNLKEAEGKGQVATNRNRIRGYHKWGMQR